MSYPYGPGPGSSGWAWPPAYGPSNQPGVPFPAGAPGGPVPPGGPGNRGWVIAAGVGAALVVVIALVVAAMLHGGATSSRSVPDTAVAGAPPSSNAQSATDCTHSVSSGELPPRGMVAAGGLSFPQSIAPDWRVKPEHRVPNSIDAVSLDEQTAATATMNWIAQITVGVTNFDQSMNLADQAQLMLKCVLAGELYEGSSPTAPAVTPKTGRIDGIATSEIDAPVTVVFGDPTVKGDDVVIIVVATSPTTYFLGTSPMGDQARRQVVQAAIKSLHVASD